VSNRRAAVRLSIEKRRKEEACSSSR
jgi:hypothetical protein